MLSTGNKLGPYEIISALGAGGMGEVYKAKDSRLDRTVAIKVLPTSSTANEDLRQRFEREAKAVSSLNHPNICILYDVGHQDGIDYLVMEYIEGETLAVRLEKGPLPTTELLRLAIQIADALEKAHRQGLVHRDLKPGNIMLTKSGAKLLDFGLAKLQEAGGVVQGVAGVTRTTPLTGAGTIIGTLQYMAPEQLEGNEADARSDIFAFGSILYEMATGHHAFEGKSQASLIAAILKENPRAISELQPLSPPMLERVIKQCMEKEPDDRWNSAGDVKRALQWISEGGSQVGLPVAVSARRRLRERVLWGAVAVLAGVAATLGVIEFTRMTPEPQVVRFAIPVDASMSAVTWPRLSPDGKTFAFTATDSSGRNGIWIRPLNSLDAHLLVYTTGAQGSGNPSRPFWSPDSKQLAYFENNQLKKVSVAGGLAQLVCEAARGSDGSWGSSGVIVFDGSTTDSIRQVPASGGTPTGATPIDRAQGETFTAWPSFLPDGEHFLYLAGVDTLTNSSLLKVGSIKSLESITLTNVDTRAEYSPPGHVIYLKNGILVAQPFDAGELRFTGEPVPLASRVSSAGERAHFSVSDNGVLVYQRGQSGGAQRLLWLDRKGDSVAAIGGVDAYGNVALSPDGSRLAYELFPDQGTTADIWVRDLKRDVASRLTFGPSLNVWPVWSHDGARVLFCSNRATNRFHIFARNVNGTGGDEEIFASDTLDMAATDVSRDGESVILYVSKGAPDTWRLRLADKTTEPLLSSPFTEARAAVSPDGRFLAYQSDESGVFQIYVRELSPTGGKWQISTDRGRAPVWRADGKELFYLTPDFDFMAVPISYGAGFEIGTPAKLFNRRHHWGGNLSLRPYQVTSDGQRFVVIVPADNTGQSDFVVVQNWAAELGK
jgi:Tol biopolymer transport system component/predicted Ser/Thr protein kinase